MASKVSLADALAQLPRPHIGGRCYTCVAVQQMDDKDRAVFDEALANKDLSNPMITKALHAAGYEVSRGSLARHRRGECSPLE